MTNFFHGPTHFWPPNKFTSKTLTLKYSSQGGDPNNIKIRYRSMVFKLPHRSHKVNQENRNCWKTFQNPPTTLNHLILTVFWIFLGPITTFLIYVFLVYFVWSVRSFWMCSGFSTTFELLSQLYKKAKPESFVQVINCSLCNLMKNCPKSSNHD